MNEVQNYVESKLARFVRTQRIKGGYNQDATVNGYTFDELEKRASRIAICKLSEIFSQHFDLKDTQEFWLEIQLGIYERRKLSKGL